MKKITITSLLILFTKFIVAQPFTDIATFNYQTYTAGYKNVKATNKTDDYFLNFFLPKEFKNGNILLIRLNSEYLYTSTVSSTGHALASISLPFGFQLVTKDKKWKTVLMAVPKIASDFRDQLNSKIFRWEGFFCRII